jgi:patatin-like phospholipase/acyl hydrolase
MSELVILKEIMQRIKRQQKLDTVPLPCEHFDMIGGTSTGGCVLIRAMKPQQAYTSFQGSSL